MKKGYCVCGNFNPHVVDSKKGLCLECGRRLKMTKDRAMKLAEDFWMKRYPLCLFKPGRESFETLADFGMEMYAQHRK